MITSKDLLAIKDYLEGEGIIHVSNETTKMDLRKGGKTFSMSEHIEGMVFSLLSAQTVWANIERNRENIRKLFFYFDKEEIKKHDYMYFYDGLGRWNCRGRLTKAQLSALHYNISVFEKIEAVYGSMDAFVISGPVTAVIDQLSRSGSEYKLKQMGVALVCEYLRNVGVDCFKNDVHLERILGCERLGDPNDKKVTFDDLYAIIKKLSDETGLWMGQIDYILWAYCATGMGEICTAEPRCSRCVVSASCNRLHI